MKRLYISGPLTDKKTGHVNEKNLSTFRCVAEQLRELTTFRIVDPTRVWVCRWPRLYRWLEHIAGKNGAYRLTLLYDLWLLSRCDYIYKLPGWRESRGANVESCLAFHMDIFPLAKAIREKIRTHTSGS